MSGGDEFLLKWNDHHNSFFNIMQELCANEVLTDVTLACGGRVFETHKIMLCVCSAFFRQVLTGRQSNKHPIVFLKDIRPKHLEQLLQYMYNGEINVLQEDLAPLIDAARALQIKGLADTPSSNSSSQAPPPGPAGLNGKQPKLNPHLPTVPAPAGPPPMKRARPPGGGGGGMNLMNHTNRRKAESPKQILQHPHAQAAQAAAAAAAMAFLPTQPLPPAAAMSPLALQQHQQQEEDEEEEEELTEDAPLDHRQIKEDHIEIYGSDEGVSGGHGGGGDPGGDGEISEEMYQDDDMQDDGSQTPPIGGGGGGGGVAASAAAAAAAAVRAAMAKQLEGGGGGGGGPVGAGLSKEEARNRYRCEECGKGFITPSKLQRHSFSHSGLRPFHCDVCGKSFSQAANLKTHIRNTHPEVADALAPPRRSTASSTAATPSNANAAAAEDDDDLAAAASAYAAAASAAAAASLLPPKSEADH